MKIKAIHRLITVRCGAACGQQKGQGNGKRNRQKTPENQAWPSGQVIVSMRAICRHGNDCMGIEPDVLQDTFTHGAQDQFQGTFGADISFIKEWIEFDNFHGKQVAVICAVFH